LKHPGKILFYIFVGLVKGDQKNRLVV